MRNIQADSAMTPAGDFTNSALRIASIVPKPERLEGWKEIAAHLGRSARCVQRWEKNLGLPIHRIRHTEGFTVYALPVELEAWRASREPNDLPPPVWNNCSSRPREEQEVAPGEAVSFFLSVCRNFLRLVPLRTTRM